MENQKLSVYIHWPFCKSKCPYCDFNSHVRDSVAEEDYINSYLKEIDYYKPILNNRTIISIFIGGGTPSTANPKVYSVILNQLNKLDQFSPEIEITIEVNPTSAEINKFAEYVNMGINRVSIGVQSFNDQNLKFLGREHSASEAHKAIEMANHHFLKYNFDLIYALPNQSLADWNNELTNAIKFSNGHLSLYQLTIEKGTQFYTDYKQHRFTMPKSDLAAEMYNSTQHIMESYGLPQYEISNHAKKGFESIHNINYWEYGDYIGIGAGAHGRFSVDGKKYATVNHHLPEKWLSSLKASDNALQSYQELSEEEQVKERIIVGLRLATGIDAKLIESSKNFDFLIAQNFLEKIENKVRLTEKGRLVLNTIIDYLT